MLRVPCKKIKSFNLLQSLFQVTVALAEERFVQKKGLLVKACDLSEFLVFLLISTNICAQVSSTTNIPNHT